jgi:hypothetical protein
VECALDISELFLELLKLIITYMLKMNKNVKIINQKGKDCNKESSDSKSHRACFLRISEGRGGVFSTSREHVSKTKIKNCFKIKTGLIFQKRDTTNVDLFCPQK